jgi:flagellar hook-associated protein FlgK
VADPVSMDTMGIGLSGMQSAQTRVAVSAHNVANLLTEDFRPQRVLQTSVAGGGSQTAIETSPTLEPVSLDQEMIDQIVSKAQFKASARVVDVGLEMRGSLLDILA